jgi:hypothetical protein
MRRSAGLNGSGEDQQHRDDADYVPADRDVPRHPATMPEARGDEETHYADDPAQHDPCGQPNGDGGRNGYPSLRS